MFLQLVTSWPVHPGYCCTRQLMPLTGLHGLWSDEQIITIADLSRDGNINGEDYGTDHNPVPSGVSSKPQEHETHCCSYMQMAVFAIL